MPPSIQPLAYSPHLKAVTPVLSALKSGRQHHANLWSGPEGIGKYLWARKIARYALCMSGDGIFDDRCPCVSCQQGDQHPDLVVLGNEPESLKVDRVRQLLAACALKPMISARRVVIIRDVHLLTPQAQNAFLKTLEEPPGQTIFILLTHQERKLLQTIRSRCQHVRFSPLDAASLRTIFHELLAPFDDAAKQSLLDAAAGSGAQLQRLIEAGEEDELFKKPLGPLLKAPIRDRLAAAETLAESQQTTQIAAIRLAAQLAEWARTGQPHQTKRAIALFDELNELVLRAEGNGNRRLLWEKWLLSV
ncbi:MAG: DNA polymerase III subunit [Deltaproteobacteria bacterium]|nr:DNA polymerase III subunit [Deltaproteobacteria bacterium]